jgi:hypothetical protein
MLTLNELIADLTELRDKLAVGTEQVYFRGTPYEIQSPIEGVSITDDGEVELLDDYTRER